MRQAHRVRQSAGTEDRLRRAAAALAVRLRVGPQLQRHRDHLAARPLLEQRGRPRCRRRRSWPPARAPAAAVSSGSPARETSADSARCSASAARSAAWSFPGEARPARPRRRAAPTAAASSSGAPSTSDAQALPAAIAAPHPRRRSVTSVDAPVLGQRSAIRTRSPQGAPPALPTYAPSGDGPACRGKFRCSSKRRSAQLWRRLTVRRTRPGTAGLPGRGDRRCRLALARGVHELVDRLEVE